jgi:hypothetical protein
LPDPRALFSDGALKLKLNMTQGAYSMAVGEVLEEVGRLRPERVQVETRALYGAQEKHKRAAKLSREERQDALFNAPGGPAHALKQRLQGTTAVGAAGSGSVLKQVGGSVMSSPRDPSDTARTGSQVGSLSFRIAAMKLNATNNHEQLREHRDHLDEVLTARREAEEKAAAKTTAKQQTGPRREEAEFQEGENMEGPMAFAGSASAADQNGEESPRSPRLDALDDVIRKHESKGYLKLKMEMLRLHCHNNAAQIAVHRSHLDEVHEARRKATAAAGKD